MSADGPPDHDAVRDAVRDADIIIITTPKQPPQQPAQPPQQPAQPPQQPAQPPQQPVPHAKPYKSDSQLLQRNQQCLFPQMKTRQSPWSSIASIPLAVASAKVQ